MVKTTKVVSAEVIEAVSLAELCRSCGVRAEWVVELVDEGILDPAGQAPAGWRFSAISITRVRTAWRLYHDLGVNKAGIAVALNLIDEREQLQQAVKRLERVTITKFD
ncbi:chaperone modulator CbpM [Hoeflea prorocentri]|uniref:Chaperone modulator CbpM n=1 Tax=Hoeflea prorocentri TaxID=1922333 RepID=A0A9X3UF79_9HYPH|nr:chaperone modulator CbpM [Hoeflea prorocentri]MCY6379444.1 chaperone modulator CbpM [Hoeflea prorocentri]MDA5397245.1 chaperone modulator CbpM [Hoeflea prorocentri]